MNGMNPFSRIQPGAPPQQQSTGGMGPYAPSPRVQAAPMQRMQQPAPAAPKPAPQQGGGMMGGMGGMMGGGGGGGMMAGLSDERSKTEIARLEGQNEALTAALDQSFNGSNMPATEYPQLPQSTRLPSRGRFADSPASNQVAGQNVMMLKAAQDAGQLDRGQQNAAQGGAGGAPDLMTMKRLQSQGALDAGQQQQLQQQLGNPGFARPNLTAPDMSELDRAYARMGQGG